MKNPVSVQPMPVYQAIATALDALRRCEERGNAEWLTKWTDRIQELVVNCLPSGSGVDRGTHFDFDRSTPDKLVFNVPFHHMDSNGYYCGWTDYQVIVTPTLAFGVHLRITGRDRNQIKDYLHGLYDHALTVMLESNRPVTGPYVNADGNPHETQTAVNS